MLICIWRQPFFLSFGSTSALFLLHTDLAHGLQVRGHLKNAARAVHHLLDGHTICELGEDESCVGDDVEDGLQRDRRSSLSFSGFLMAPSGIVKYLLGNDHVHALLAR